MKAYRILQWQQPAQLVEVPVPEPGPGQVRIKIAGNGICQSDLHLMQEWSGSPPHLQIDLPMTIGHEPGGYIDKLGPGVSGLEHGQPIVVTIAGCGHCRSCARGWNNYCMNKGQQVGMGLDGGLAEYTVAPAAGLVPVPTMDPVDAAPLTDAGLSSYHAVKRVLPLLGGGTAVAVIGVGGLGHLAVQALKALTPAKVIAYDLNQASLALALDVGADSALKPELDNMDKMSVEVVLDFVGAGATLTQAAHLIKPLGHIVMVGRGPGIFEFTHSALPYGTTLSTTFGGSKLELMELIALAEAGYIQPHITRFSLDEVERAYALLAKGEILGRGVVVP